MEKELTAEVDRILWEEWDPIGVNDLSENRDEYSSYVPAVVEKLRKGATHESMSKLLSSLSREMMHLGAEKEARRAAKALLALHNGRQNGP